MSETAKEDPILTSRIGSPDGITERLQMLIGGEAVSTKASQWGVSNATLSAMLKRRTDPSVRNALKIAESEEVHLQWLLAGVGPMKIEQAQQQRAPTNTVLIPMYEVDAAAGAGSWITEENVTDYWYIPQTWLYQERLEHADLCIINAVGDSMTPGISHGDRLLVKKNINRDNALSGIFVINMDGNLRVKRLEFSISPAGYHVKSDSELYPDEFIPTDELADRLYIIGEVVRVLGAPPSAPVNVAPTTANRQPARVANNPEKDGVDPVESPSAATKPGSQVG